MSEITCDKLTSKKGGVKEQNHHLQAKGHCEELPLPFTLQPVSSFGIKMLSKNWDPLGGKKLKKSLW